MRISYHKSGRYIEQDNVKLQDILEIVQGLNETDSNYIHIWNDAVDLSVLGGHPDRLVVVNRPNGRLVDTDYTKVDGDISMRVDDGTTDIHPIYQTVTKGYASKIVKHILEQGKPPKESQWTTDY